MRDPLLLAILAALAGCEPPPGFEQANVYLDVPEDSTDCPAPRDVDLDDLFRDGKADPEVLRLLGDGVLQYRSVPFTGRISLVCAYPAWVEVAPQGIAVVGRPYREAHATPLAAVDAPDLPDPAARWLHVARLEHASVAAFARLTLDLMALGAPLDLLADVQRAAADEVRHAALCRARAEALAGRPLPLGPVPFAEPVVPCADPVAVAVAAVREGCLGETASAWFAARDAERAPDPDDAHVLAALSDDETRHAALSWRLVAWLLRAFPQTRPAVVDALHAPFPAGSAFGPVHEVDVQRLVRDVLDPAARALLAA